MPKLNDEGSKILERLEQAEQSGRKLTPDGQRLLIRLREVRDSGMMAGARVGTQSVSSEPGPLRRAYETANLPAKKAGEGLKTLTDMIPDPETPSVAKNIALGLPKTAAEIAAEFASSSISPESLALMAIPGGSIGKAATKLAGLARTFAKKNMPKTSQALTGVAKKYFERVFENPSVILPKFLRGPKSLDEAGEALGAAERKAFGEAAEATAKEINDPALSTARKNAIKAAEDLEAIKKFAKDDPEFVRKYLSDPETGAKILKGKRGTQAQLDQPSTKGSKRAQLKNQEQEFNEVLEEYFPEVRGASLDYAKAKTREQVMRLLPVLKSGDPSIARLVLSAVGRTAGLPLGFSVPAANAVTTALTRVGIDTLEKLATNPRLKKLVLAEIMRRRSADDQ